MRLTMANFLSEQLDFIFFFYGLAFILLGATCFAVARSKGRGEAWAVLGWFGFIHGASEWLDLTALVLGDAPDFAAFRIAVMAVSFVLLLEFARLEAIRLGMRLPGRWIHVPLILALVIAGASGGANLAGILARYGVALVGALAVGAVFALQAATLSDRARRPWIAAAAGFALYAVAAGAIVPNATFWPAAEFNYRWFAELTGTPIQLVRGVLACWISFSIWAIRGSQLALEVSSARYTAFLRQQFVWTLAAMATILVCGWTLTEFLGAIYRQNVQEEARGDIDLLASRLTVETATIEGMVKALAGSPSVLPLLADGSRQERETARAVLDLDVEAAGARGGYILDKAGVVVAASNRREAAPGAANYSSAPYFRAAIGGAAHYHYAFDPAHKVATYFASHPIRDGNGDVIGVAVLTKSLDAFEADLRQFDRPYFFIDPDGVVVMTNRPAMLLRMFWPLAHDTQAMLLRQFGAMNTRPLLQQEVADGTWTQVDGERDYVRRRFVSHGGWSLVILKPTREIYASRVLGIVITLLVTIMTLIYLLGRGRWIHDTIQLDNRLKLQQLARDLGFRATTDPLTGLPNRLKFDEALAQEMLRADRYKLPLSLVLYDVDHFKRVNDTHGHQAGDKVLVEMSRVAANLIRSSDLLARWGGEEFAVLLPGCDAALALQAAEKLRDAIEQTAFAEVGTVTCSFGVAQYVPGQSAAVLIAQADEALYRAKINGRNKVELSAAAGGARAALATVA